MNFPKNHFFHFYRSMMCILARNDDDARIKYGFYKQIIQVMWFDDSNKKEFIKISEKQFNQRYQIIQSLGKGNYGQVFKAKSAHGNLVALKSFKTQALQQFHMILREVSNLKKLDHANILKFYDCYIVDDYKYYMVTEFCQGGSLPDFISQIPQQRPKLALCQQMAEGLAYAHEQGIVHRDLKPQNILIGQRNVAKIGDFGCSTRLGASTDALTSRVGSPAYMDYRVGRRQEYDHTADLYSLGMVFLWVFQGKGIYDECKSLTDLNHHQSQISRDYENSIQRYVESLPAPIDAIVKSCLSPDYRSRFPAKTIASMIAARLSQDKSSTNLVSTQDQLQESVENERVNFAYKLMALTKDFQRRHRNQKTRDILFRLLRHNQQALESITNIQGLRYVNPGTKAQFTFIVVLYYHYWLQQIRMIIHEEPSQLSKRYPEIDPKSIEAEVLRVADAHIAQEKERVAPVLLRCAQRIQSTLHLVAKDIYLPQHFREFVRAANQREPLPFSLLQEKELLNSLGEFFTKRVKADYDYLRGCEEEHDDRLKIVEKISKSFQ